MLVKYFHLQQHAGGGDGCVSPSPLYNYYAARTSAMRRVTRYQQHSPHFLDDENDGNDKPSQSAGATTTTMSSSSSTRLWQNQQQTNGVDGEESAGVPSFEIDSVVGKTSQTLKEK